MRRSKIHIKYKKRNIIVVAGSGYVFSRGGDPSAKSGMYVCVTFCGEIRRKLIMGFTEAEAMKLFVNILPALPVIIIMNWALM